MLSTLEEALELHALAWLPSACLQNVSLTCRLLRDVIAGSDGIWAQCIRDDFGGPAAMSTKLAEQYSGARAAHRKIAALRKGFDEAVLVLQGDFCEVPRLHPVDALICPAVPICAPYGPCATAVHELAGPELMAHVSQHVLPPLGGFLTVGNAVATPAFRFPGATAIVHTVGPTWRFGYSDQVLLLGSAYRSAFEALERWPGDPLRRVVTASVSTGGNGLDARVAASIAMPIFRDAFLRGTVTRLYVVLYNETTYSAYAAAKQAVLRRFNEDPPVPNQPSPFWQEDLFE